MEILLFRERPMGLGLLGPQQKVATLSATSAFANAEEGGQSVFPFLWQHYQLTSFLLLFQPCAMPLPAGSRAACEGQEDQGHAADEG